MSAPSPGHAVTWTEVVTGPDGLPAEQVITYTEVITSVGMISDTQVFSDGMMIISNTLGYTESHLIHVMAYDAAGNETESGKVRIWVAHKPPKEKKEKEGEKKKEESEGEPTAWLRYEEGPIPPEPDGLPPWGGHAEFLTAHQNLTTETRRHRETS